MSDVHKFGQLPRMDMQGGKAEIYYFYISKVMKRPTVSSKYLARSQV